MQDTRGARSAFERLNGELNAAVEIELRKPELYIEHIAHELEHVLEQVDGTDLPRLARQGLNGVVNRGRRLRDGARSRGRADCRPGGDGTVTPRENACHIASMLTVCAATTLIARSGEMIAAANRCRRWAPRRDPANP